MQVEVVEEVIAMMRIMSSELMDKEAAEGVDLISKFHILVYSGP